MQFRTLFGKFFVMYWRSPSYNATRFVMTACAWMSGVLQALLLSSR